MFRFVMLAAVLALVSVAASAATTEELIDMAKKGTPEDQLLKEIDATPSEFNMGVSQVIALREAHCSDKVIAAMLRHVGNGNRAAVAANPPAPFAPQPQGQNLPPAPPPPLAPPRVAGSMTGSGRLVLDNLDDRAYAYYYEPSVQTLWIAPPNGQAGSVQGHTSQTVSMKAGTYQVRYSGQPDAGVSVTVYGGDNSAINISRVVSNAGDVLQATVFERGERKATGQLAAASNAPAPQQNVVEQRTVVQQPVYTQAPVYYETAPTYYYGPSYYSYPRYYGGSYYGGGYYGGHGYYGGGSSLNLNFGFGGGHRR